MTFRFWRRDCEIHSAVATVKPEVSVWGKEAIAEIGTSPQRKVVFCSILWLCISSLQLSQVQNRTWSLVLPSDVLRLGFQHNFNEIWLLLNMAVLPLILLPLTGPSVLPPLCYYHCLWCLAYQERQDQAERLPLCLILSWSVYCSDQLHTSCWDRRQEQRQSTLLVFLAFFSVFWGGWGGENVQSNLEYLQHLDICCGLMLAECQALTKVIHLLSFVTVGQRRGGKINEGLMVEIRTGKKAL